MEEMHSIEGDHPSSGIIIVFVVTGCNIQGRGFRELGKLGEALRGGGILPYLRKMCRKVALWELGSTLILITL